MNLQKDKGKCLIILLLIIFCRQSAKGKTGGLYIKNDTTHKLILKGKMLDTVTEEDIRRLCDHCAMAIRFEVEDFEGSPRAIDVVVFDPDYKADKFYVLNGKYTIIGYKTYSGPKVLISPACKCRTKEDTPLICCESLRPDF